MKKLLFSLCLIFFFSNGCKKDSSYTTVEGVVLDKTTYKPIANATVYLEAEDPDCFTCSSTVKKKIKANNDGSYSFDFDADDNFSYYLYATADRYFENNSYGVHVETGEKNKGKNIYLQPESFLKLHIRNIQLLEADEFHINEYFDIYGNYVSAYYGTKVDTFLILHKSGNLINQISTFMYKSGNLIAKKSYDIYCPSFDTTYYDISY